MAKKKSKSKEKVKPKAKKVVVKKAAPKAKKVAVKAAKPAPKAVKPAVTAAKKAAPVLKAPIVKPVKLKKAVVKAAPVEKAGKKPVAPKPAAKPAKEPKAPRVETKSAPPEEMMEAQEAEAQEEVVLTDAEGRRYCRVKDCDQLASVDGYCRYHYLLYWKKIQIRKKILSEGKLERYIEELTARYPDKFLDMLRKDLRSEKEFLSAIQELEIDESAVDEFEDETQTYIDEVRGMGEPTGTREEEEF